MKKPDPEDFGITPEQYRMWNKDSIGSESFLWLFYLPSIIVAPTVHFVTEDWRSAFVGFWIALIPGGILYHLCLVPLIKHHRRSQRATNPIALNINRYQKALNSYAQTQYEVKKAQRLAQAEARRVQATQQRTLEDHWNSLSGEQFERELGSLYRELGYAVEPTSKSGDGGVDLVLTKDGRTTIVQCKRHNKPAGPAVVRELYGTLNASTAERAILACPSGFTQGVLSFTKGKPIDLISMPDLLSMAKRVGEVYQESSLQGEVIRKGLP